MILSGDVRQHRAVEAGDALRILQARGTVVPAELTQIHRQQGAYREAMRKMGDGDVPGGYRALEELGWVREVANDNRHEKVANDYLGVLGRNKTSLVVAPTHLEGRKVTELIRKGLRAQDRLKGPEKRLNRLRNLNWTTAEKSAARNYETGQVVQFIRKARG